MRISYLSPSFIPSKAANSVHVMKMCNALAGLGHDVFLNAATRNPFAQTKEYDYIYYGVSQNHFRICKHWFPRIGFAGRLVYSLLSALPGLLQGVDLYFSRHPYSLIFASLTGRPFIMEMHAPPVDDREHRVIDWLIHKHNFRGMIVISDALKAIYKEIYPGLSNKDIVTAHDGADIPKYKLTNNWQPRGNNHALKCGYTGHLYPGRGIDVLLALAAKLPQTTFHIVGGTEADVDKWHSIVSTSNVHFYGHQPPAMVPEILESMDVLLAPYQDNVMISGGGRNTVAWMSPLKVFEYMAASKPIVCSDLPVLREVLHDNVNCLLVPPKDINSWESAIRLLGHDKGLRDALGNAAGSEFTRKYSWSARASSVLSRFGY